MDKKWMELNDRFSFEYREGVKDFLDIAFLSVELEGKIPCPCVQCNNAKKHYRKTVGQHLIVNGIVKSYNRWIHHGEHFLHGHDDEDEVEPESQTNDAEQERDNIDEMLHDIYRGPYGEDFGDMESTRQNTEAENFDKLTMDAKKELYPGCKRFSKLSFIVRLLHMMSMNNWTQRSLNMLLQMFKELLPDGAEVPASFYEAKKVIRDLGLNYVKIDVCKNDCVLFWDLNEHKVTCPTCGESRWKSERVDGVKIPQKSLRYFPIKSRLKRLFSNKEIALDMRWHKDGRVAEENLLRHPADGLAWKEFDRINKSFAQDPRNVRLGLSSDGFNPYSNMSTKYSMWPVMLVTYNLPPWKAMKQQFIFLSLRIPGPKSPGNDIDVFLQPLIKDLVELWEDGVETYDASSNSIFRLRAALLWTISDFLKYANLSGWSTKEKLACPICNEETSFMQLSNGHKTCYMGHRRFLPNDHKWRENKSSFDGKKEHRGQPKRLTADEVQCQLQKIRPVIFGKSKSGTGKRKREPFELNWTKRVIFHTLPYWRTLLLPHNQDVMHIEKNISEAILGTLLNICGKTKDTINSRLDLQKMGIKKDLHPIAKGKKLVMPTACYTLSPEERKKVCEYWESLKLPDGYSSNFSRCINSGDGKMAGMKTHDLHIFLQCLLPLAIRAFLPKDVCEPLIELGLFFKELCSKTLKVDVLDRLGKGLIITLCKLESIFPPSFFDIMLHLPVQLTQEAVLGGPVQGRWMYAFERRMHDHKQSVGNKAYPEGSIAEGYIFNESLSFCSMYLHGIETKHTRKERNYVDQNYQEGLSVFMNNGRLPSNFIFDTLTESEKHKAHLYVLDNCDETQPYVEEHKNLLKMESLLRVNERHAERFSKWFEIRVRELERESPDQVSKQLRALSWGPDSRVMRYKRYIINGYRFHTKALEKFRKTQNSGVFVVAEHEGKEIEFYGVLKDIIELEYQGENKVVLFKYDWWNLGSTRGALGIRKDKYGFTSVNTSKTWYDDQPYILAYQAGQVYYVHDIKLDGAWQVVLKNAPRDNFDFPELPEDDELDVNADPYQEKVGHDINISMDDDDGDVNLRRYDVPSTEIDENIQKRAKLNDDDDFSEEDDASSEDAEDAEMLSFDEDEDDDIFT